MDADRIDFQDLRGRRVMVIGASGFLGAHVARRLDGLGARVFALSRSVPELGGGITSHRCDASDEGQVRAAFAEIRPDVVYHLTSDSRGGREVELIPDSLRNDVAATLNVLLEAHRQKTPRIVLTASMEEPMGDAGTAVPSSPYAAAKWVTAGYARMLAALHGLPVVVLRLMMTFGPGQKDYKVIPATIRALLRGEPMTLSSGVRPVDWVYVDDVTDAFVRAALVQGVGAESIDIGTGRLATVRDVATLVGEVTGRPDLLRFGALGDRQMEMVRAADTGPAERLLGWKATTDLRDGLAKTVEWYRERP